MSLFSRSFRSNDCEKQFGREQFFGTICLTHMFEVICDFALTLFLAKFKTDEMKLQNVGNDVCLHGSVCLENKSKIYNICESKIRYIITVDTLVDTILMKLMKYG